MYPDWLNHVDGKRQRNLVQILQYLSRLQDKENLDFIIIGALPLLVRGYLAYTVYWDIDLLFEDDKGIREFMHKPKKKTLRIFKSRQYRLFSIMFDNRHTCIE